MPDPQPLSEAEEAELREVASRLGSHTSNTVRVVAAVKIADAAPRMLATIANLRAVVSAAERLLVEWDGKWNEIDPQIADLRAALAKVNGAK